MHANLEIKEFQVKKLDFENKLEKFNAVHNNHLCVEYVMYIALSHMMVRKRYLLPQFSTLDF